MTIRPGDFWVADIPFTDGRASKRRPVLVLWLDGRDAVVAAVTSASPRTLTDVPLTGWRAGGLRVASTAPTVSSLCSLRGACKGQGIRWS